MAFKLKDLMVDLLPGAGAAGQNPAQCPAPSAVHCPLFSIHCPMPSMHCPTPSVLPPCTAFTVAQQACVSPSVAQPLCPFPSVGTQCPFPSLQQAAACISPSVNPCNSPSMNAPAALAQVACPFPSLTNPGGTDAAQLTGLATLKEQLRAQLAQVEQHEQAVHAAAKPQTVDEAQSLLQKLEEAMAELKAHIDELKKQA